MLRNIIFGGVLIVALSAQFAYSLKCNYCVTNGYCTDLEEITCDEKVGNETNYLLDPYFFRVPNKTSTEFECIWLVRAEVLGSEVSRLELRSCAYRETRTCNLYALQGNGTVGVTCRSCRTDLCNKYNSAPTFSNSKIVFPLAVITIFFMKVLKT